MSSRCGCKEVYSRCPPLQQGQFHLFSTLPLLPLTCEQVTSTCGESTPSAQYLPLELVSSGLHYPVSVLSSERWLPIIWM